MEKQGNLNLDQCLSLLGEAPLLARTNSPLHIASSPSVKALPSVEGMTEEDHSTPTNDASPGDLSFLLSYLQQAASSPTLITTVQLLYNFIDRAGTNGIDTAELMVRLDVIFKRLSVVIVT